LVVTNRVDIEALLNPLEESWMMGAMTEEEIFWAVLTAWKEGPDGDDSNDVEDNVPLEPCVVQPLWCS
jgi:hypothetical protein